MVFKRNTLRNTKTFKQSTSINTSKINNPPPVKHIPTPHTSKHVSGSGSRSEEPKRQTYNTKSTNEWSLSDLFPNFKILPDVYADRGDNFEKTPETDFKVDPSSESLGSYEELYNSPGGHRQNAESRYNTSQASAQEIKDSMSETFLFTPEQDNSDKVKLDPYPDMQKGAYGRGFIENKDGSFTKATIKPGSTPSKIKDYVANEKRISYYNLPSDVSQSAHQAALDRQSMYKFENSIQKSYSTMLRGSGPGNRINEQNFLDLKSQINRSNIPQSKKDDMISEYTNKISNYQKAAGGYGTANPWSFGTSEPKNPNKAEKLKQKIDSGNFTGKDWDQYQTLTGNPVLYSGGTPIKADGTIKPKVLTYKDLF